MSTGHHYMDAHGNAMPLPPGTKALCAAAVTARNNVNMLMKRQVTMHKQYRDRVTGQLVPAAIEMHGSHEIPCSMIPDGCR